MPANAEVDVGSAVVEFRPAAGQSLSQAANRVAVGALFKALPWRTFRSYKGQKHYSGKYWSVTDGDHVIYESRLELSAARMADFDRAVHQIKAQPFFLTAFVNGRRRSHIPDYLLNTDAGPVLVDVVRGERLENPKIQLLCDWTKQIAESLSWDYQVVSEQPPILHANIRFLAGYRREYFINAEALERIRSLTADLVGVSIGEAEQRAAGELPQPLVRSALMHLLWRQEFCVDLTRRPLGGSTVLEVPK